LLDFDHTQLNKCGFSEFHAFIQWKLAASPGARSIMTVAEIRRHEPPQAPSACPGTGLTPSIDKTSRALKRLAKDFGQEGFHVVKHYQLSFL